MRKRCSGIWIRFALGVFIASAAGQARATASDLSLLDFRGGAIGVFQSGGNSFSGELAWAPGLNLGALWVRADLAATLLKGTSGSDFVATGYQAFAGVPVTPLLGIEAGGGAQTWLSGNGGTNAIASGNVIVNLGMGLLDHAYAGYSRYFLSNNGTNEIRAGVGIRL